MSALRSLVEHFVAPPSDARTAGDDDFVAPDGGPDRACAEPAPRTPPGIGLLAAADDARPLGAALGLAVASHRRAPVVVVCVWTGGRAGRPSGGERQRCPRRAGSRRPSARAGTTRELRGASCSSGSPRGRSTPASGPARVGGGGAAPTVLALGGPRVAEFEDLLAEQDLVVVATPSGTDPALRRLALAGVGAVAARVCACEVPPAQLGRAAAAAGLVLLPSARRPLADAVEALP